jgi:hypothetical protein
MWWRFDRYEVDVDYIRPAAGASLEMYDPWGEHVAASLRRKNYQPPYVTLARLSRDLDRGYVYESSLEGSVDQHPASCPPALLARVAEWCSQHGLPGSLLHTLKSVTLADRWAFQEFSPAPWLDNMVGYPVSWLRGKILVPTRTTYEASSTGWARLQDVGAHTEGELSEASADEGRTPGPGDIVEARAWPWSDGVLPPPGKALSYDYAKYEEGEPAWFLFDLADRRWSKYFPNVKSGEAARYEYPMPCSEPFWRLYAEPMSQFLDVAGTITQMLGGFQGQESANLPVETMHRLLYPTQPTLQTGGAGRYVGRWSSPSLMSTMALMAFTDLTGGDRIALCPECEGLYVSRRSGTTYCSERCKSRARKKRQRNDPAFRARELERQRAARRNPGPSRESGQDTSTDRKETP